MKRFLFTLLCTLPVFSAVKAEEFPFGDFLPEKLAFDATHIYVISTFEEAHFLTVYDYSGKLAWEVRFNSKIISTEIEQGMLFVYSKARDGSAYFLSCITVDDGKLVWEKPIWSPSASPPSGP